MDAAMRQFQSGNVRQANKLGERPPAQPGYGMTRQNRSPSRLPVFTIAVKAAIKCIQACYTIFDILF
jgi:hypothetical protein